MELPVHGDGLPSFPSLNLKTMDVELQRRTLIRYLEAVYGMSQVLRSDHANHDPLQHFVVLRLQTPFHGLSLQSSLNSSTTAHPFNYQCLFPTQQHWNSYQLHLSLTIS